MAGKAEIGKQFLDELLAKIPAAARTAVSEVLSSPEAASALEFAGSRVAPLDEERTRLHEQATQLATRETKLNEWHGRLDTWKTERETDYAAREKALKDGKPAGGNEPPPRGNEAAAMTKADVEKTVNELMAPREAAYVQYVADATHFATFHLQNFKEPLDVAALVRHEKIGELGVRGVYELLHKEKLDKMRTDATAAERQALKDELRKEIATEQPIDMPYPQDGSPLDALLLDPDKRPKGDPLAATRMYEQLTSGRT